MAWHGCVGRRWPKLVVVNMESQRSWSAEDITSLFDKLKLDCEEGKITEERYNTVVEGLEKPYHSYEAKDDILSRCESMVHDYKKRRCNIPKKEFDTMISSIANYIDNSSILMSDMHVSLVEIMDDIVSATFARILEEEGKLVGCTWRGLLDSMDGLNRRVVPADVDGNGYSDGQCFICLEYLAKEGAVAWMTDCGYSCHSRCLLQWHAENAACPNFCGFELQREEAEDDEGEEIRS